MMKSAPLIIGGCCATLLTAGAERRCQVGSRGAGGTRREGGQSQGAGESRETPEEACRDGNLVVASCPDEGDRLGRKEAVVLPA